MARMTPRKLSHTHLYRANNAWYDPRLSISITQGTLIRWTLFFSRDMDMDDPDLTNGCPPAHPGPETAWNRSYYVPRGPY